jgi:hypothetical protein
MRIVQSRRGWVLFSLQKKENFFLQYWRLGTRRQLIFCFVFLFYCPQANGRACVDFGCTHPIDGLFLTSTHLFVGFLLKIWMLSNWFTHAFV